MDANTKCRICGSSDDHREFQVREMMFGTREKFAYFECRACGCLQIVSIPEDMAPHYPAGYYSYSSTEDAPPAPFLLRHLKRWRSRMALRGGWFWRRVARPVLGSVPFIEEWLQPAGLRLDSRILEAGCGSGHLLEQLALQGFSELTGTDPFLPDGVRPGGGVRLLRKDLSQIRDETFDYIMLHHAFEHLPDPVAALAELRRLLRPGGTVLLRIPLASSWAWERYGADWVQIDAPRHFYLHTERSLGIACAKAGFRIHHVRWDSTEFQFWGSEQNRADIPLLDPRSYAVNPASSRISPDALEEYRERARELNRAGRGDQAGFLLKAG